MWVRSLGWEDPLEEGLATHSSILVWRITWTEEPGRLQSKGLQRVGHHWNDLAQTHTREILRLIWMEKRSSLSKFSPFILFQSHSPVVFPSYYTFKIVLVRITSEIHMWSPMGTYPSSSLWYLSVNITHSLLKYLLSISVIQTLGFPLCHFIGCYFSVLFASLISYSAIKTWIKSQA